MLLSKKIIVDEYCFYSSIISENHKLAQNKMQAFFNYCLEHFIKFATFWLIYWKVIVGILRYIEKKI